MFTSCVFFSFLLFGGRWPYPSASENTISTWNDPVTLVKSCVSVVFSLVQDEEMAVKK